jgi:peptidoglycan hydrolase-like protein with peptidoglycan-binding domain
LDVYAHQPSFINGTGNFIKPADLSAPIAQSNGQVISGVSQNIYTYGSIDVTTSEVNPNIQYFYSVWIPLAGVGGSITDMTNDVGTTLGGQEILADIGTVTTLTALNVTVTSGAAIPAGTYRVLWVYPQFILPVGTPLTGSLFFRGDTKS